MKSGVLVGGGIRYGGDYLQMDAKVMRWAMEV